MIIKGPGGLGSWRTCGDHPNDSHIENDQNTEKSAGRESVKKLCSPLEPEQKYKTWMKN